MREILFRARTVSESEYWDDGEWIEGFYTCFSGEEHRIYTGYSETDCGDHYPDWFTVLPETVWQYTGLTDKNGKKIFEGDICSKFSNYSGKKFCFPIVFEQGLFYAKYSETAGMPLCDICEKIEIIGNIHDNPELLKGGEG